MILMPQIFDVIANENARYKHNELEYSILKTVANYESTLKSDSPYEQCAIRRVNPLCPKSPSVRVFTCSSIV